jgi:hypothetical protein
LNKPAYSVWFRFYKLKTKKTNRTEPKPKKTESNRKNRAKPKTRAKPIWIGFCPKKPNRTETGFGLLSVFFLKKVGLVIFFYKNRTELKIIIPNRGYWNLGWITQNQAFITLILPKKKKKKLEETLMASKKGREVSINAHQEKLMKHVNS